MAWPLQERGLMWIAARTECLHVRPNWTKRLLTGLHCRSGKCIHVWACHITLSSSWWLWARPWRAGVTIAELWSWALWATVSVHASDLYVFDRSPLRTRCFEEHIISRRFYPPPVAVSMVSSLWTYKRVKDGCDEALERNLTGRQMLHVSSSDAGCCFFIRASFHRKFWKVFAVSSFSPPWWHPYSWAS